VAPNFYAASGSDVIVLAHGALQQASYKSVSMREDSATQFDKCAGKPHALEFPVLVRPQTKNDEAEARPLNAEAHAALAALPRYGGRKRSLHSRT
jgi:hypothetical protein